MAAAVLASLTWFTPRRFIASGDIAPFIRDNLTSEITSTWNHQVTGVGSTSYAITQTVEVLLLAATHALGLPDQIAQFLLYAAVVAAAAFGTAYLVAVWIRRPLPVAAAGLAGVFNAYTLTTLPNLLPLLATALIGVLAGMTLRAAAGARICPAWLAAATLPVSYLAQNPPLVAVTAVAVLGAAAAGTLLTLPGGTKRAAILLSRSLPLVVLVNLFWLVPYLITLTGGSGLTFAAQTDVGAWAWTQVRASVPNVLTLNTHWGWHDPNYFPYANKLSTGAVGAVRWLFPALAWTGLLMAARPRRRRLWTLATAAILLVALSKGLHEPLGSANGWLYRHLPGMWLLRDPMSKLGAVLVAIYAVGLAHVLDSAVVLLRRKQPVRWYRRFGRALVVAAGIAAVAYPWPLYTGAVIPGARGYLPSDRVAVPTGWRQVAAYVNAHGGTGKTIVFPLDPYYQVTTTWGYHGVDTIPAQLLQRPSLQQLPGGYFTATAGADALLDGAQTALLAGDVAAVPPRLRALGATSVIVRHDLINSPDLPPAADPAQLVAALGHTPGATLAAHYPLADVYTVDSPGPVEAVSHLLGVHTDSPGGVASAVAALPPDAAFTSSPDLPVSGFSWQVAQDSSQTFTLAQAGPYQIRSTAVAEATYRAHVDPAGPMLVLQDANTAALDARPLPARPPIDIPVSDPNIVALAVGDALRPLAVGGDDGAVLTLPAQATISAYATSGNAIALTDLLGPLGDCNHDDSRSPAQAGLNLIRPATDTIELAAAAHTACTYASVPLPPAGSLIEITFAARTVSGKRPRICLWQDGPNTCAPLTALPGAPLGQWMHYQGLARLDAATVAARLYLYADGPDSDPRTVVQYRDVEASALRPAGSSTITTASAPPEQRTLPAGMHTITFATTEPQPELTGYSALADCNNTHGAAPADAGLSARGDPDGTISLTARSDTACVTAEPFLSNPVSIYRLQLAYRTIAGRPARICLWESGPNTCAPTPTLLADAAWHTLETTVHVDPGTRRLQLYLYADGQANPVTTTAYRDITLSRAAPVTILVTPVTAAAAALSEQTANDPGASVHVDHASATNFDLTLIGVDHTVSVVLAESFSPGWQLTGLPAGWTATHFQANGYANGWLLNGTGTANLRITYRSQRWAHTALVITLITFTAILAHWAASQPRFRRRWPLRLGGPGRNMGGAGKHRHTYPAMPTRTEPQ